MSGVSGDRSSWRIVGDRGSLLWDGFDDLRAEVLTGERAGLFDKVELIPVPPLDPQDRVGGHLGVMQDFIAAVVNGGEPETTGTDNIKSLAMVFGAIESSKRGQRVPIMI